MATSPFAYPRFRWNFLLAWLVLGLAYTYTIYVAKVPNLEHAILEGGITFIILLPILILSLIVPGYYFPTGTRHLPVFGISVVLAYGCSWVVQVLTPAELYQGLFITRLFVVFVLMLGTISGAYLWTRRQEKEEAGKRQTEINEKMRDAELHKLQHQLQPHFLFNSLNSINALIQIDPQQARDMVQKLSDFLRYTLKRADEQWVSLEHEMEYLNLYLDIEKIRFRHRLDLEIDLQPEALPHLIPTLILQPVVENAIKFGLYGTTGNVRISLKAVVSNNQVQVAVTNPFDSDMLSSNGGTGFGLKAIRRRLQLLYNRNDLLNTSHHKNIFTTVLNIPIQKR